MDKDSMGNPAAWSAAMQQSQATMMRQWQEGNAAWMRVLGSAGQGAGAAAPGAAIPGADMGRHLVGQFENYLGVTRSLWELLGKSASASDPAQRQNLFNDGLSALQSQFATMFAPQGGLMPSMPGNPWQAAAAGFGMPPGMPPGMSNLFSGAGNVNPAEWLQWPALGPAREHQESWQKLAAAAMRYSQAQGKLAGLWNDVVATGLKDLGKKLAPKLQSGAVPGSMRELYDNWVESAESAYKGAAHGAAFMQAQAEMSNAMSALRMAQRDMFEEWGKQFDLPTRAELNSLHQQLKQLTDAVRKLGG